MEDFNPNGKLFQQAALKSARVINYLRLDSRFHGNDIEIWIPVLAGMT
jgi:hypothetical protein